MTQSQNIKPHIKFRTKTYKGFRGYYGAWARLYRHRYGARTAGGSRTVLKPGPWYEIGCFPDRRQALKAAKSAALKQIIKDQEPELSPLIRGTRMALGLPL